MVTNNIPLPKLLGDAYEERREKKTIKLGQVNNKYSLALLTSLRTPG